MRAWVWLALVSSGCASLGFGANRDDCDVVPTWYADEDGDGHGVPGVTQAACVQPDGFAATDDDCDDHERLVHPGAQERCNNVDDDCDGAVDDGGVNGVDLYVDADGDNWGDAPAGHGCDDEGTATRPGDCDDADADVHPEAVDPFDGRDANCDGIPEVPADGAVITATAAPEPVATWQRPGKAGTPAVRIFGVSGHPAAGPTHVVVNVGEPTVLVLVASGNMKWEVTERFPGTIREVIWSSEIASTVHIPETATKTRTNWPTFAALDDPTRAEVEALAEAAVGVPVTSTTTTPVAGTFTIDPADAPLPDPQWPSCDGYVPTTFADPSPDVSVVAATCPRIAAESAFCLTTNAAGEVYALGLDSYATCDLGVAFARLGASGGFAFVGADLYGAVGDHQIVERVPLDARAPPSDALVWGGGVVADGGLVWVPPRIEDSGRDSPAFASWEDAQCGAPTTTRYVRWWGSSFAAADGIGFAARFSAKEIDRVDLASGAELAPTPLEDYSGAIDGIGVVGDRLVVLTPSELRVHDVASGAVRHSAALSGFFGLVCVTP